MNLKNICVLHIFIFRKKLKLYKGGRQAKSKLLETLSFWNLDKNFFTTHRLMVSR